MNESDTIEPLEERSLRSLIGQLSRDGSLLVQQEMALAKQELTEKASALAKSGAALAVGGLVLYAGLLAIVAAIVLGLALVLPAWVSALLVGVLFAATGAVLLLRGKKGLADLDLKPSKTAASVKRDIETMKEAIHDQA
jgi:Flp pilus assembly protein TadB